MQSRGEIDEAQTILEIGRNKAHPSADLLVELCEILGAQGKMSQAESTALAALDVDSKHSNANICLGEIYFKMGWQESALDAFERAVAFAPEESRPKVKLLGGLMASGHISAAENRCHQFLAADTDNVDLWLSLGKIFEKMEKRQAAFAIYGQVLTLDPDNAFAHAYLGIACSYLGDKDRAIFYSEKAEAAGLNMLAVWKKIGR